MKEKQNRDKVYESHMCTAASIAQSRCPGTVVDICWHLLDLFSTMKYKIMSTIAETYYQSTEFLDDIQNFQTFPSTRNFSTNMAVYMCVCIIPCDVNCSAFCCVYFIWQQEKLMKNRSRKIIISPNVNCCGWHGNGSVDLHGIKRFMSFSRNALYVACVLVCSPSHQCPAHRSSAPFPASSEQWHNDEGWPIKVLSSALHFSRQIDLHGLVLFFYIIFPIPNYI